MSQQQDRLFFRNFTLVLIALTIFGILASVAGRRIARLVPADVQNEVIAERVAPVGQVYTEDNPPPKVTNEAAVPVAAADAGGADKGKQVYDNVCTACHAAGVAGAPKLGDKDGWAPRIAQGVDVLHDHAIKGFQGSAGVMPAKGGRADLADEDVKAAVDYILAQSGGPTAPAAAAPAEAPAAEAAPAPAEAASAPVAEAATLAAAGDKGKQIYDSVCMACHAAGVAGAPKLGDKDAWAPRIAQGMDILHERAIKGFMGTVGMMPPKGGRVDLPDEDVKAAVDYMVNAAK
jgi:cytochrome c5